MAKSKELTNKQEKEEPSPNPVLGQELEMRFITLELYNALISYLRQKPFDEVNNLINSLSQSPVGKARIIDQPAGN